MFAISTQVVTYFSLPDSLQTCPQLLLNSFEFIKRTRTHALSQQLPKRHIYSISNNEAKIVGVSAAHF